MALQKPGRWTRLSTLFLALLFITAGWPALFAAVSPQEKQKIESLIRAVETLTDATFYRNGKSYNAAAAAKFLRGKWRAHENEIVTARDFIEKVASVSSTTGKCYTIRFRDGREVPSGRFFQEKLVEMDRKR